ncbi:MAG: ATP-binding cassette domain-containing protein [Pseudomonadota bacterium]
MSAPFPLTLTGAVVRRAGRQVFGPVDFTLAGQGVTVLLGPNGAGKTTFLRLMFGLDTPDEGRVDRPRAPHGAQAIVFQRPTLLRRSVLANAVYPLEILGQGGTAGDARARSRLGSLGLGDKLNQPAQTLSGGEAQKLALARAMITDPALVFLDEATANLDGQATREIEATLAAAAETGTRVVLATHDLGQARRMADDVVFMARGQITEHQPAGVFFDTPTTADARAYLNGEIVT